MIHKRKKIVVIGGGTGTFTVLSGLKKYPVELTAIVSMADDGGSTGVLRDEFGMLPAGDIRRALVALSSYPEKFLTDLFTYRFRDSEVDGHNFGNLILVALERVTGSFEHAVAAASRLLDVRGTVLPVTFSNIRLFAELENGEVIKGETNIDIPKHDGRLRITRVWLEPEGQANSKAIQALQDADMIVVGPGDLFTSIIPNFLISGIQTALRKSKAKKIYVMNLMTKHGETNGFSGGDFLRILHTYLGADIFDAVLINHTRPPEYILRRYKKEMAEWVSYKDLPRNKQTKPHFVKASLLRHGNYARHDSVRLGKALMNML
ncbi:MAG: hypothetical protein A3J54_02460 [Candidatus Ryanbacteria bacterium RIFCSPHIGHO2_02_FULL_45_13b]|uniref:Putative gluconeogenesis factor n=1 Tax=Candidatus Ryanbacteria bacterium RIFCSPHIGHO2_02_FULL_45_13b TaxID=1802117 RepID=A0A1G2G744_9BACT|nr:MAG: hypothetical protein A3J54_02460 [Candidatus Ryanbacteria bacterium RIFCSPHIGHO2_02_FULL_45_13b]